MRAMDIDRQAAVNGPVTYYVRDAGTTGTTSTRATINEETGVLTATALGAIEVVATDPRLDAPIVLPAKIVNSWVNAEIYYDDFYVEIHDDENTSADEASQRIATEMQYLTSYFWTNFGIQVNYNTTQFHRLHSFVDPNCNVFDDQTGEDDGETICSCDGDFCYNSAENIEAGAGDFTRREVLHHTNAWNVLYRHRYPENELGLDAGDNPDTVKLLFSGRNYCRRYENGYHDPDSETLYGIAFGNHRVAMILSTTATTTQREKWAVVHEFGHLFGTEDYYDKDPCNHPGCIYGEDYLNAEIERDCTMCDSCKATITAQGSRYSEAVNET